MLANSVRNAFSRVELKVMKQRWAYYLPFTRRSHSDIAVPNTLTNFSKRLRCSHNDPGKHTTDDLGLFYTVSESDFARLCPKPGPGNGFSVRHLENMQAFNECAIMVRRPALEVINYLKHTNFSLPVQRYLIYGDSGTGKSITLQHITHYCLKEGWLILPTMYAWQWNMYRARYRLTQKEELLESQWNKERFDQPVRATAWLEMFRSMNASLLGDIHTTKDYIWTKRDKTESGTTFSNLVDLGIARPRIATDVIGCIMREIRFQPPDKRPRTLVTIDGFEALFSKTWLRHKIGSQERLDTAYMAFYHNLKKMVANIWSNGAVVVSSTGKFTTEKEKESAIREGHLIYDIIGHEGFDLIDPHIPVEVPNYTDSEVFSQLDYYEDRKWLLNKATTPEGRKEIMSIACNNPLDLDVLCGGLC